MLFIGIDLSDKSFDSCITNSNGDVLTINKFDFDDNGFSELVHKINEHESEAQNCIIGIENPRCRLVDFLIQRGFNVIPTHPLSISKYRESRIPSKAKSDPMDARLIADYKKQAITVREAESIKNWLDKYPKKERAELFDNYIMDRMKNASEHSFQPTGPNYSFNHLVAKLLSFLRKAELDNKEWIEAQRKILDIDATLEAYAFLTLYMKKMGLKTGEDKKEKKS